MAKSKTSAPNVSPSGRIAVTLHLQSALPQLYGHLFWFQTESRGLAVFTRCPPLEEGHTENDHAGTQELK